MIESAREKKGAPNVIETSFNIEKNVKSVEPKRKQKINVEILNNFLAFCFSNYATMSDPIIHIQIALFTVNLTLRL